MVAQKTHFQTVSHPNITNNHDPINIISFSINSFDYLLQCILHGTAKRHNYTQPYGVNVAKRNAASLHPQRSIAHFPFTTHCGQPYIHTPHNLKMGN